jgi:hypothetical protein
LKHIAFEDHVHLVLTGGNRTSLSPVADAAKAERNRAITRAERETSLLVVARADPRS